MPQKVKDGFNLFQTWLIEVKDLKPSTARSYTSLARVMTREVGTSGSKAEMVTAYLDSIRDSSTRSRSRYSGTKRSWKLLAEWAAETTGERLALPIERAGANDYEPPHMPEEVQHAVRALHNAGISAKRLVTVCWKHVELVDLFKVEQVRIHSPYDPSAVWTVLAHPVQVLFRWADLKGDLATPLVVLEPGSVRPYPFRALEHVIHTIPTEELNALVGLQTEAVEAGEDWDGSFD